VPTSRIEMGYNTKQILNYGYERWDQLFNDRQLLALSMLATGITELPVCPEREALAVLFSGVLEFNNMFASYKGEGTGAVRHMFSHHILKPERTPIEANVWGTSKSSGSFSTLFTSRLLRALNYKEEPFEIALQYTRGKKSAHKAYRLSRPIRAEIFEDVPPTGAVAGNVYLSCGNSADTGLGDKTVSVVVTDPPFFDNVHYSELADFFYVWQQLYFPDHRLGRHQTTRDRGEVQDNIASAFALKLKSVFVECHRVLKDDGLLVFSYHHSREDGWSAVADAVFGSGFVVVQSQPVKAEMSVATPKRQAKNPIDLDVLIVCRKRSTDFRARLELCNAVDSIRSVADAQIASFNSAGRRLSRNDVLIVLASQAMVALSAGRDAEDAARALSDFLVKARVYAEQLHASQQVADKPSEGNVAIGQFSLGIGLTAQTSKTSNTY